MREYDKLHKIIWVVFYICLAFPLGGFPSLVAVILLFALPVYSFYRVDSARKYLKDKVEHIINVPMLLGWVCINWFILSLVDLVKGGSGTTISIFIIAVVGVFLIFIGKEKDKDLSDDVKKEKEAFAFSAGAIFIILFAVVLAALSDLTKRKKK